MHSRSIPTVLIPISDIKFEAGEPQDHRYIKLFQQFVLGKCNGALTRLPRAAITSGFYYREGKSTLYFSRVAHAEISSAEAMIRSGQRPLIDVYWSPLSQSSGGYVCPDDEVMLAAYGNLKINLVPCRILKPKQVQSLEASIWIEPSPTGVRLAKAVAPTIESFPSFVGDKLPPCLDLIPVLIKECSQVRVRVQEFHQSDQYDIHYHQMLYAVLRRHERILDSIGRLIELQRIEHASALTRVAYEAFLNFYIDWLCPEFFGPRLQLLSAVRSPSSNDDKSDDDIKVLGNFVGFFENAAEKARISPLGSFFHDAIYPKLSLISHQSYQNLQEEALQFGDVDISSISLNPDQVGRWLDVITAALTSRISNEIGEN